MFAIVRTGGKQYRVAPGDKIVVEKLAGEAGDSVDLTDILLAGEGSDLKSTAGLIVAAEIVAQAKADKVTVFKKRRRHNYRRKAGHRQKLTILKIISIGGKKADKKAEAKAEPKKAEANAAPAPKTEKPAPKTEKPAAKAEKAPAKTAKPSTKDAAPAKAAAKKAAPKAAAKPKK
ncbi:MAG: 50S ribosomal protein L21 [Sphingomonas sp.]|uniref:50S ribosomal protein L21 n=1 Tax=Sphingomonas sp. TaxID=28214 RepID=UPI0017F4FD58|nr:50S ribosomal protein L21 [Sphingomonas sp.]MBA3667397.1 50S ribosomal protein L21 [Sphingomonas sp.]